jgi:hypothetical protein
MGILKHRFTVADFLPLVANSALTGGRLVKPAAANGPTPRVDHATAATDYAIGAVEEDAVVDQRVSVSTRGVQQLTANAAIAFNTDVVPAAAGRVAQGTTPATDRPYGRALQAAAAQGDKIWVLKYQ